MRGLEVRIASQHHAKAGELLLALQEAFGIDDVALTLGNRIRRTEADMEGVGYSYDRADAEEERQVQRIIGTVLGV